MSPVEQIALTMNIALRRDTATLDYYRTGSVPILSRRCRGNGRPTR